MNVDVFAPVYLKAAVFVHHQDYNFSEDYYRELKKTLRIKRAKNISFVRVGKNNDGGYIMADDFLSQGGGLLIPSAFPTTFLGIWIWRLAATKFFSTT